MQPQCVGELHGMGGDRESLRRLLDRIRATLQDAERMVARRRQSTALHLKELKELADDVEDLLDDFEYEDLRSLIEGGSSCRSGSPSGSSGVDFSLLELPTQAGNFLSSPSMLQLGSLRDIMAGRIAEIWRRFDEMAKNRESLNLLRELDDDGATQVKANGQVRETSSFLTHDVLGRDRVAEEIIEFLVRSPEESLSVVAIVGIGGVGKTTLAKFIYNDERVGGYFSQKMWVHVSCDLDVKRVTRQIIEQVPGLQSPWHQMDNLNALQMELANALKGKRFLLVLDDMWYEDHIMDNVRPWEALCAPLLCGGKGSKILVTTRHAQVTGMKQPVKTIELEGLEFEDSWSLFKKHAFADGNSGKHPNMEDIGKKIVEKLHGVPLAVVAIGSTLYSESEESGWMNVLNSELWELEQGEMGILPALRLSYDHLPPHLKPCFAYFSVFPKGWDFDELELIQLWMASGYIESQGRKPAEDVGSDYLDCLIDRALVVESDDDKFSVHHLLHDLGRLILHHDCSEIEINLLLKVSAEDQHKRHLSLTMLKQPDPCELENLQSFRRLRTLTVGFRYKGDFQIPCSCFENLAYLRVLNLSYGGMVALPDSIGNLRHLRYLDLCVTPIKCLPDSLCTLYMLQTLKLQGCDQLGMLPRGISNLINLRHLEAKPELVWGISGICKLAHLQFLDVFSISDGEGIKIGDLKDMDELQGRLYIQNLQRVVSKEEASQANLTNKKYTDKLKLEWVEEDGDVNQRNSELEEAVLDALLPPLRLKKLTIKGYGGVRSPSWMKRCGVLECVSLSRCPRWDALPPLIGRLSSLRKLKIEDLPQLQELPLLPSTLTDLCIDSVGLNTMPNFHERHQLESLLLCNIQNMKELPPLPTTLKLLKLERLQLETLPEFHQVHGGRASAGSDTGGPCLQLLKIVGCQNLRSLGGLLGHHLPCLVELCIQDCEELTFWPEEEDGFRATLESIKEELVIERCLKLMPLPEGSALSPSLKKLVAKGCPRLVDRSLFSQMKNLHGILTGEQSGYLLVEQQCQDLASCCEGPLQQLSHPLRSLIINFIDLDVSGVSSASPFISLEYEIRSRQDAGPSSSSSYPRLTLGINSRRNSNGGVDHGCSTLSTCLRRLHHLCSSLDTLCIDGNPCSAGGGGGTASFSHDLPTPRELRIANCGERLPVETLLCHLRQLQHLCLMNCPELTLASVEEALQSLPSLQCMVTLNCPKISAVVPVSNANRDGGCSSSSSSSSSAAAAAAPPPPPSLQLRTLQTDDVGLMTNNRRFVRDYLASVHHLVITGSEAASLPAAAEEWPRSVRCLTLNTCPNLEELPPNLGSLVPSLVVLSIRSCPKLRCMRERSLLPPVPSPSPVLPRCIELPWLDEVVWFKVDGGCRLLSIEDEIELRSGSEITGIHRKLTLSISDD